VLYFTSGCLTGWICMSLNSGLSPLTALGREYALAVATDATGSTRPIPGVDDTGLAALKRPSAAYC